MFTTKQGDDGQFDAIQTRMKAMFDILDMEFGNPVLVGMVAVVLTAERAGMDGIEAMLVAIEGFTRGAAGEPVGTGKRRQP